MKYLTLEVIIYDFRLLKHFYLKQPSQNSSIINILSIFKQRSNIFTMRTHRCQFLEKYGVM